MIPSADSSLNRNYTIKKPTSRTYRMDLNKSNIRGITDKQEAVKQAIYKILGTERYRHAIYSWNYGVEFADLLGQSIAYVLPEIKRRITEALTADDRIKSVDSFSFEVKRSVVHTAFTVRTIYGDTEVERVVDI